MNKSEQGPSISLCMIVKNEERFLAKCLESVKDCVDEMIVVDTGSTDETVKIAESFGAQVFHHTWENDFSKHRNQSIGYAKGDWIFWLDADEALEPGGCLAIREATKDTELDSIMITMVCYFGNRTRESWNNSIKLFRNRVGIRFEGAVHNQVVGYEQTRFCPVKIYHYGYDVGQNTIRKKFERTSTLLKRAIEREPENFRHHHDLAVCFASIRKYRSALEEGLSAIDLHNKYKHKEPNILWTYFVVASSYFNLGMMKEAKSMAEEAIRINPEHIDSLFVLASIHARYEDRSGFEKSYHKAVALIEKYRNNPGLLSGLVVNKINEKWRLNLEYGTLFLNEESPEKAQEYFEKAIDQSPEKSIALRHVVIDCRKKGCYGLAESFLEDALDNGMDPLVFALEKALLQKTVGDQATYKSTMQDLIYSEGLQSPELMAAVGTEALELGDYPKAETLFLSAIEQSYEDPRALTNLALACKYQGHTDDAIAWNIRALDMDKNNVNALANLGNLYHDQKEWDKARSFYEKAIHIKEDQSHVLFRLSLIALMDQDLSECVAYCDRLMQLLHITKNMVIDSINDLALVYQEIGAAFLAEGKQAFHVEAARFAETLKYEANPQSTRV